MADKFANFAELSAAYVEGTDFTVKYEKKGKNFAVIAIHGGGIEVGSSELLYAIQAARPNWSWYEFNARLSSGNSVLHLTSTHFDDPRAVEVVESVDRVVSVHGAAGTEAKTLIGGLDVLAKDLVKIALEKRGFVVENATSDTGIAGQEPMNIANRSSIGGVQLELTTKQRAMLFKDENTSRSWRENPDNWSQYMFDYRDAVLEGVAQAYSLREIGRDSISIIDLNDVISSTKPVNPSVGQIWLDKSRSPYMMQEWDGNAWVDLGEVSPDTSDQLDDLEQQLKDIASDSLLSYTDRQDIKDRLTKITGSILDDTAQTMPTVSALDAAFKGEFYTVRKSAQLAGISTSNSTYTNTADKYNNLKSYLEALTPIKPWDAGTYNAGINIAVVPQTFRDKWLQYQLAIESLQNLITFNMKNEIDNIEVGGANLLDLSSFAVSPTNWNGATLDIVKSTIKGEPNELKVTKSDAGNSYGFSLFGTNTLVAGKKYTLSFAAMFDATVTAINYIYLRGDNISNTRLNDITVNTANAGKYVRYTLTFTPSQDVVNAGVLIGLISPNTTPFFIKKVQLEKGNRASDWSLSNGDITNGIDDVNGKIDNVKIGAKNLIRNSTFNISNSDGSLASWRDVNASLSILPPEDDQPNANILYVSGSGATSPVYKSAFSNTFQAKQGDVFTVSIDIKVTDLAAWDVNKPFFLEFYDATGARVEYGSVSTDDMKITLVNNTWARGTFTMSVTDATVTSGAIRLMLYKNGSIYFRRVQVEAGNRATDYAAAPEDLVNQYTFLEQRVADAEQKITDEAIVSAVTESTAFIQQMNNKADTETLANYATGGELDEAINGVSGEIDKKIAGIDFSPYTKKSELTQTANDLTAAFAKGGGVNMLHNSAGFAHGDFWTVSGYLDTIRNDELSQLGMNSGFYNPQGHSMTMTQDAYTTIGQVYTLSYYLKKTVDTGTYSYARVDIVDQAGTVVGTAGYPTNSGTTNGYERLVITFTAKTGVHTIKYTVGSGTDAVGTGFMLNIGEIPLQWSLAVGELYNTNVQMNMNGLRVVASENEQEISSTVMTPENFGGYFDTDGDGVLDETKGSADEVFRVDKDEFVMKKATVKEEITMGTIKVVRIESTASTGWAFVSNQDDN